MAVLTWPSKGACALIGTILRFFCQPAFLILLGGFSRAVAGGQPIDEYHLKAAFLYNFVKFVDWPPEAFKTPGEPITICVLGHDPFGQSLNDAVAGKVVGGRSVAIRSMTEV